MKVIDRTASGKENEKTGTFDRLLDNVKGSLSRGESEAQDILIAALGKRLDNRYTVVKDVIVDKLDVVIPLVLVGPTGIWVIYPSNVRGIYRLTENTWEEMDSRTQSYKPVKPNIIVRAGLMARSVEDHLSMRGFQEVPQVEPVLFFSDPGVHIETSRPAVRIVLPDAVDRFVARVLQGQANLEPASLQLVIRELGGDQVEEAPVDVQAEKRDAFSFSDEPQPRRSRSSALDKLPHDEPELLKRLPFSRRQLMVLGFLLVMSISAVIFLIVYILATI